MDALKEYAIPVHSLGFGHHTFTFDVDWGFFEHFDNSPVQQGRFSVDVVLDKQQDHWAVNWEVEGVMDTECDRCLAPIGLPVRGEYTVFVKYEDERGPTKDDEVIYVPRDIHVWNIAQLIYEFVLLSVPVSKTYACDEVEPKPCDEQLLERLKNEQASESENPVWDVLKQIEENN